ncbi:hypothetical protein Tco_1413683 [Tanacetum coccineum]
MDLCTKLSNKVHDVETTKTAQAKEIASLKKRVNKLERKRKLKTLGMKRLFKIGRSAQVVSSKDKGLGDQEDASKQGRKIDDIDQDAEVTLVDKTQGSKKVNEEVVSTAEVSAAATITTKEITLAQALAKLRSVKPKVVDKGKAKMIEPEKPLKIKEQTRLDEELAFKLKAEEEEQARLARKKAKKESSLKRAGKELEQEKEKKQKIDDDQEEAEMKKLIKVVPDEEEITIDSIPLTTKPPSIVDWKIAKEGKISQFQIIRANGSSKRYSSMIQMLRDFNREDLETLWKLVKAKHGST